MGGVIESVAFIPPDRAYAKRVLAKHPGVQFLDTSENEKICFMHFSAAHGAAPRDPHGHCILFAHGNAEDLATSHQSYQAMAETLGVDIFAFDPPGYALSSGDKPSEAGYLRAADSVLQHLLVKNQMPREKILFMGRSLGSGVATDLASRNPGHAGLILVAPIKSAAGVAGKAAAGLLYFNDVFPNIRKIAKVRSYPVIILHGDADEVVPYDHGVALFDELRPKNKHSYFVTLRGAGHNDIEQRCGQQFFGEIRNFIAAAPGRRAELKAAAVAQAAGAGGGSSSFSSMSS